MHFAFYIGESTSVRSIPVQNAPPLHKCNFETFGKMCIKLYFPYIGQNLHYLMHSLYLSMSILPNNKHPTLTKCANTRTLPPLLLLARVQTRDHQQEPGASHMLVSFCHHRCCWVGTGGREGVREGVWAEVLLGVGEG